MNEHIEELISDKVDSISGRKNAFSLGRVYRVQEYILEVSGLDNVGFFERVFIGEKAEGYVSYIGKSHITVELVKKTAPIYVGDEVSATGEEFSAYYSPDSVAHVIDIFGEDKLNGQFFKNRSMLPIKVPVTPIMDRAPVKRPLHTGITGIDMLYPIGKGQRQLIIGNSKTGKTQLALDTIVNQRDSNVICIYVAVGKTKKSIKEVYGELYKQGAMGYTIILTSMQDDCAPASYLTPQVAMSIADRYMKMGSDVLVIFDDLKKHADIYREINLLAGKVPGRDAYPTDIFYTHAQLLEKGCQHKNGGSITVLPIVETLSNDITDYISTNIISITDGQIVTSSKAFEQGQKPAINFGLSVSRLGGAVQDAGMRKIGAKVRRELLSYLETREVFELANIDEMNEEMQIKIRSGREMLKRMNQYKFSALSSFAMQKSFADLVGEDVVEPEPVVKNFIPEVSEFSDEESAMAVN